MFAYTSPLPQPDITSDHSCPYVRVMFTQIVLLTTSTRSLVVSLKSDIQTYSLFEQANCSWGSGRGLLEVYQGWTAEASAGDLEEVY